MIHAGEDELICDFAETYRIYDYRSLDASLAATLAAGLGGDSRIKLKMSGLRCGLDTMLLAMAVDRLSYLLWAKTKDAKHGRNKPESIYEMINSPEKAKKENEAFDTAEDFDLEWQRRIMEASNG